MSVWLIQPRDPLIFRDGKPFNATPGAEAKSLPFPHPSTLAGGVRTRAGMKAGQFDSAQIDRLLQLSIRGPLLVSLAETGAVTTWYLPAPADCLIIRDKEDPSAGKRLWVRPIEIPAGATTNLELGVPVSTNPVVKQKPHTQAPRFWNWETMQAWLKQPHGDSSPVALSTLGISGLTGESRVHVRMNAETKTAAEGFLFQTSGLEFSTTPPEKNPKVLSQFQQYALAVETDAELQPGIDFLGGERRIVTWAPSDRPFPTCPAEIRQAIIAQKHCRLLLATPALFTQGYLPTWLHECIPGLTVTFVAAALPRYQGLSGWDARKGTSKASRRLAPAGSVYFLSLKGDEQSISHFIDAAWLNPVSDAAQDRREIGRASCRERV